jgi:hypothetical protein
MRRSSTEERRSHASQMWPCETETETSPLAQMAVHHSGRLDDNSGYPRDLSHDRHGYGSCLGEWGANDGSIDIVRGWWW